MHMADALLSPAAGGTMWAVSAGMIGYSSMKVKKELDGDKVPLMGVLGAFIFAAQMINFTIPGTGSSGHLGGGMILAALLGGPAAFLVIASVLTVQALLFADGGLLALGCNIFNLGFIPAFIAYPLIYRPLAGTRQTPGRIITASVLGAVAALQLGAFSVVLQTAVSGISDLPFRTFLLLMQPVHLAIGLVEGAATAAVVLFVWRARPGILGPAGPPSAPAGSSMRRVLVTFLLAAAGTGGILSWFASTHPDGLEWSMFKTSGSEELAVPDDGVHAPLAALQQKTALMPDYGFKKGEDAADAESAPSWPAADTGTSAAGIVGGGAVLLLALLAGWVLKRRRTA